MCIIDIMKTLAKGENYVYPIKDYNKIGREIIDNFDMFVKEESSITPFKMITSKDRLNISVENKIYGSVKLNPMQAKKLNMPKEIENAVTYRTHTVIRDGQLNAENIELILDNKTYATLKALNVAMTDLPANPNKKGYHVTINLKNLPIIDSKYKTFKLEDLKNNLKNSFILEIDQKVVKYFLKKFPQDNTIAGMNEKQTELANEYSLDKYLTYKGIDNAVAEKKETYTANVITFKMKGYTIPKVDDILKRLRDGKSLNMAGAIMKEFYDEYTGNIVNNKEMNDQEKVFALQSALSEIKGKLISLRLQNLIMRFTLVNSALQEVAFDTNGKFQDTDLTIIEEEKEFQK